MRLSEESITWLDTYSFTRFAKDLGYPERFGPQLFGSVFRFIKSHRLDIRIKGDYSGSNSKGMKVDAHSFFSQMGIDFLEEFSEIPGVGADKVNLLYQILSSGLYTEQYQA